MLLVIRFNVIGAVKPAVLLDKVARHAIPMAAGDRVPEVLGEAAEDGTKQAQSHGPPGEEAEDAAFGVDLLGLEVLGHVRKGVKHRDSRSVNRECQNFTWLFAQSR